MKLLRLFVVTLALPMLLIGCATAPHSDPAFAAVPPPVLVPPPYSQGSIYKAGYGLSLFNDSKAHRVGDILTVLLMEKTDASKKAGTKTKKSDDFSMDNPTILGAPLSFPLPGLGMKGSLETKLAAKGAFDGSGDSSQSNSLSGRITVTVAEVLPNGNLRVRGEKRVTINQGDEYQRFSGIVRPVDIQRDNTVESTLVADAKIVYAGEGAVGDANTQGWLGRVFNSKWWPF